MTVDESRHAMPDTFELYDELLINTQEGSERAFLREVEILKKNFQDELGGTEKQYSVDWNKWLSLAHWTPLETAALSMNWDPCLAKVVFAQIRSSNLLESPETTQLRIRSNFLLHYVEDWAEWKITPALARKIAEEQRWDIPNEFKQIQSVVAEAAQVDPIDKPLLLDENVSQKYQEQNVEKEANGPLSFAEEPSQDEIISALFDPVTVDQLERMFPASGKWKTWAERADRNKLVVARVVRARFDPYLASRWFLKKGIENWDLARCNRVLVNNLPARSMHNADFLTPPNI